MSQQLFKVYLQSLQHTFKDLPKANFYWRFHKRDLNRIITIPCPVDEPTEVQHFKELRAQIGIKEEFVCSQCPHHTKCKVAYNQPDGGNMQTLDLPHLSKFLQTIASHNMSIKNDAKSYWLASSRVLDTFHAVLIDFQLNQNKLNTIFLEDMTKASETDSINQNEPPKKADKYTKNVDFLDENQNTKKRQRKDSNQEPEQEGGREDKFNRYGKGNYANQNSAKNIYGAREEDKPPRFNRRDQRGERQEYESRGGYGDRDNRKRRSDSEDRGFKGGRENKYEMNERNNREFRGNRYEKYETNNFSEERNDRNQKYERNNSRNDRYDKGDKYERRNRKEEGNDERLDRFQRKERQEKVQKEEEDFDSFVKQREEYLQTKKEEKKQQTPQESTDESNEGITIESGRKIKKNMKFRVAQ